MSWNLFDCFCVLVYVNCVLVFHCYSNFSYVIYDLSSGVYFLACLDFLVLLIMYDFKLFSCRPRED